MYGSQVEGSLRSKGMAMRDKKGKSNLGRNLTQRGERAGSRSSTIHREGHTGKDRDDFTRGKEHSVQTGREGDNPSRSGSQAAMAQTSQSDERSRGTLPEEPRASDASVDQVGSSGATSPTGGMESNAGQISRTAAPDPNVE